MLPVFYRFLLILSIEEPSLDRFEPYRELNPGTAQSFSAVKSNLLNHPGQVFPAVTNGVYVHCVSVDPEKSFVPLGKNRPAVFLRRKVFVPIKGIEKRIALHLLHDSFKFIREALRPADTDIG